MASSLATSSVEIRCKGILFDMDGILISSLGSVERSWTKWAKMRGLAPAEVLGMIHGRRAIESVAILRPDLDPNEELNLIEDIELADGEGITVLPGVKELIAALPRERWTVVTSATERSMVASEMTACSTATRRLSSFRPSFSRCSTAAAKVS